MRDIVQKAKDGDLEAFGQLVERFQDAVYGTAYALLGDFHDAQDLAQESFIRVWQNLKGLRDPGKFPGWLYQITRNCCLDFLRRKEAGAVPLSQAEVPASDQPTAPEKLEKAEMREAVLDAIRALSEPNRLATTLFYIDGYSVQEVAEFLAVPSGTVKRRLYDSRKKLRERMIAMVEDELKGSRPGPEFQKLVQNAIRLQAQEQFEKAVSTYGRALKAAQEEDLERLAELYFEIHRSYKETGRPEELPEAMLGKVTECPADQRVVGALNVLHCVVQGFLHAGCPDRAGEAAERMSQFIQRLKDDPAHWPWRGEALWWQRRVALAAGDEAAGEDLLKALYANLEAAEAALKAAVGSSNVAARGDDQRRRWHDEVGGAYHNLAMRIALHDEVEGLRLMRRALELYDHLDTRLWLAGLVLSVEKDREAALAYVRTAARRDPEGVKKWFQEHPALDVVREDPEFLAVLEG